MLPPKTPCAAVLVLNLFWLVVPRLRSPVFVALMPRTAISVTLLCSPYLLGLDLYSALLCVWAALGHCYNFAGAISSSGYAFSSCLPWCGISSISTFLSAGVNSTFAFGYVTSIFVPLSLVSFHCTIRPNPLPCLPFSLLIVLNSTLLNPPAILFHFSVFFFRRIVKSSCYSPSSF